jgi:hypothetical protein
MSRNTESEMRLSQLITTDYQRCREALARQRERAEEEPSPEDYEYPEGFVAWWEDWVDYEA